MLLVLTLLASLFFEIKPDPTIYSASPSGNQISRSGITTGDYFVIKNTFIGDGVTGIKTTSSGFPRDCWCWKYFLR